MKFHISLAKSNIFFKNSFILIKKLYAIYFQFSFWVNFKKRFTKKLGTVTSNLTKSAFFWNYTKLDLGIKKQTLMTKASSNQLFVGSYFYHNTLIPFNFHSKVYNTLVYYFITLLTTFYVPTQNEFKLYYAFIWQSKNLLHYDFLNKYYFKIKNY